MSGDSISTRRVAATAPPLRRRSLLVLRGAETLVHELPLRGEVTVGRGSTCEIRIDDASLSRSHLRLHLAEDSLELVDLGSANGTSAGGVRLVPRSRVAISANDPIAAGDVTLVIQDIRASGPGAARGGSGAAPSGDVANGPRATVVQDPALRRLYALAARLAQGDIGILITGETGAGKDVLAEYIHRQSPRASGPLIRINCAALVDTLVEAELFGHERGAFTGAVKERRGLIEAAHGGTLLLDEVGETSPALQAKLLRVLEDRQVLRVGASEPRAVDVRFIAATNRDLEASGFRRDLYFRLAGAVLAIPPLRERPQEIAALANAFAAEASARRGQAPPRMTEPVLDALRAHAWPGNARELRNVIERAILLCDGPALEPGALGLDAPTPAAAPADVRLRDELGDLERERILAALERHGGNQSRVAAELGIPRRTLIARLDKYDLPRPRKR